MRYLILVSMIFFMYSCNLADRRVSGNGNLKTEQISIAGFNKIRVSGGMHVQLKQQDTFRVDVNADENLMEYIEVFKEGETLVVREMDGYNLDPSKEMIVYVSAPTFSHISVSGSGSITSENTITGNDPLSIDLSGSGNIDIDLNVPKINAEVSGSGTIDLGGRSEDLALSLSGSGNAHCFELITDNIDLNISGSANAEVTANKTLDARVSGSGDVQYKGNAMVTKNISGSGSIEKVN